MTKQQQHPITLEQHPMTPPAELFKQWEHMPRSLAFEAAYRAGADQQLEACREWIYHSMDRGLEWSRDLRAAMRPKPPSLAEQALAQMDAILNDPSRVLLTEVREALELNRRALERLQELEAGQ